MSCFFQVCFFCYLWLLNTVWVFWVELFLICLWLLRLELFLKCSNFWPTVEARCSHTIVVVKKSGYVFRTGICWWCGSFGSLHMFWLLMSYVFFCYKRFWFPKTLKKQKKADGLTNNTFLCRITHKHSTLYLPPLTFNRGGGPLDLIIWTRI